MAVAPSAGRLIAGKYRLLERVGVGVMSEVYRAEVLDSGRVVALKVLLPQRADDPSFEARLIQEAHSGFRIRHASVVEVLDVGQSDVGPYIAMEFLSGESAARVLVERGKLGLPAALATMFPVLDGLEAAHEAGVVHRDLKPGNVFYCIAGRRCTSVKLLDFGVAKTMWPTGPVPLTSTGVVMGTPDYLSPEQANGELTIDGRSDVFAAGVLLFELVTGTRPFHAPTAVATAYKIAHARTPSLKDYGGPPDPTLQAILERALAKRPDERYPNARAFAGELRTVAPNAAELARALDEWVSESLDNQARVSGERLSAPLFDSNPRISSIVSTTGSQNLRSPASGPRPTSASPARGSDGAHVRGVILRAVYRYVGQVFGADAMPRVLATLPAEAVRELEHSTLQAIVLYDIDFAIKLFDTVTRELCASNVGWARSAGVTAVTGELGPLFRGVLRPDEVPAVVRRLVPVLSRLVDFGSWELDTTGHATTLRVTEFEPASAALRLWMVGVLEGALAAAGVRARTVIARGDSGYAPHLVVDVLPG